MPYAAPSNELEALAATTFAEVFNLDKVGINDEFFELGGDSLLAEVLSFALTERTGIELQPSALVERGSPREIARLFNGKEIAPGWLDVARYANSASAKIPILKAWRTVLRHLPEAPAGEFADDRDKDFQVVPAGENAPHLILVFCGHGHRFAIPLNMIHRWLRPLGAHIVYLRDFRKLFYLSGVRSLGRDYASTVAAFRKLIDELGATSVHTMGNSAGVYGALQMGLDLRAQSVLCLAGMTGFTQSKSRLLERVARELPKGSGFDPAMLDLRYRYESASSYPRIRHVYGAANDVDRMEAERLGGLDGSELVSLPSWEEHLVIDALIGSNEFVPTLEWMLRAKAISRSASPSTSQIGGVGSLPVSSATEQDFHRVRKEWRKLRLLSWLKPSLGKKRR
jgi:acyl carrier protein